MKKSLDFLIIGAMKSGTTTLHDYLNEHPGIYMLSPKEPQYFSRDKVFSKGRGWYEAQFDNATNEQFCGESSTCYSRFPKYDDVVRRIYNYSPSTKLIYIMRHPVERAYSHYGHLVLKDGRKFSSFEEALEQEPEIISTSLYMSQIQQYLALFPKNQLLLIDFEEMIATPEKVIDQVQSFLGLNRLDILPSTKISNDAGNSNLRKKIINRIRLVRHLPIFKVIIDKLFNKQQRGDILNYLTNNMLRSGVAKAHKEKVKLRLGAMTNETRKHLLKEFKADTESLFNFWDHSNSDWFK